MTRKVKLNLVEKARKRVIILTGPSGSGKSSLAKILAKRGWRLLDADQVARELYARDEPGFHDLVREFGSEIVGTDGNIDRKRLGALVFASPVALRRLDRLLTPRLIRSLRATLKKSRKACVDMAIYFKAGAPDFGGRVVLVDAPLALRVRRLVARGHGLKTAAAAERQARALRFGASERRRADLVLNNAGTLTVMRKRFFEWLDQKV